MKIVPTCGDGHRRAHLLWLCAGMLAVIAASVVGLLVASEQAPVKADTLMLIYVGADDCAPCRAWQRDDRNAFRHSKDFAEINYREVKAAQLRDILDDKYWPEDIREYRSHLKRSDGVPLWLIVTDNDIVVRHFGAAAWKDQVLPALKAFSRRSTRGAAIQGSARPDAITCNESS